MNGTVIEPPEALTFWLYTTCGAVSGAWSGIRSTVTFTLPLFASQGTDDRPLKVTDAAPVYPLESPMMATARLARAVLGGGDRRRADLAGGVHQGAGHVGVVAQRPPVAGRLPGARRSG